MKNLIFFLVLAGTATVNTAQAQSVSNVRAKFTDCHAVVTFNLDSAILPTSLTLWYSHDNNTWLPCTTVSGDITGQTSSNGKTII
jgi:hypothetical protein